MLKANEHPILQRNQIQETMEQHDGRPGDEAQPEVSNPHLGDILTSRDRITALQGGGAWVYVGRGRPCVLLGTQRVLRTIREAAEHAAIRL